MRRLIVAALLVVVAGFILQATPAKAVEVLSPVCNGAIKENNNIKDSTVCKSDASKSSDNPLVGPNGVITRVIQIFSLVIGVVAIFAIIISGLRLIISAGDSNAVAKARRSILYALVGLLVVGFAQVIVSFVLSR